MGNRGLMKIQYARSKLKCIKLNLDTAENGENKNYINNNIHTFNLLLMVSHFCDFGARLWKYFAVLKVCYCFASVVV